MGSSPPSPSREPPPEEPPEPEPAKTEWWPAENKDREWFELVLGFLDFL